MDLPQQRKDAISRAITTAVARIVIATQESALRGLPNGHLFADHMHILDIDQHNKLIQGLKDQGCIQERGHLLSWIKDPLETYKKICAALEIPNKA